MDDKIKALKKSSDKLFKFLSTQSFKKPAKVDQSLVQLVEELDIDVDDEKFHDIIATNFNAIIDEIKNQLSTIPHADKFHKILEVIRAIYKNLSNTKANQSEELQKYDYELQSLAARYERVKASLDSKNLEFIDAKRKLSMANSQNEDYKKAVTEKELAINEMKEQLEEYKTTINNYEDKTSNTADITKLEDTIANLRQHIHSISSARNSEIVKINQQDEVLTAKTEKIAELELKVANMENMVLDLESDNEELKKTIAEAKEKISSLEGELVFANEPVRNIKRNVTKKISEELPVSEKESSESVITMMSTILSQHSIPEIEEEVKLAEEQVQLAPMGLATQKSSQEKLMKLRLENLLSKYEACKKENKLHKKKAEVFSAQIKRYEKLLTEFGYSFKEVKDDLVDLNNDALTKRRTKKSVFQPFSFVEDDDDDSSSNDYGNGLS